MRTNQHRRHSACLILSFLLLLDLIKVTPVQGWMGPSTSWWTPTTMIAPATTTTATGRRRTANPNGPPPTTTRLFQVNHQLFDQDPLDNLASPATTSYHAPVLSSSSSSSWSTRRSSRGKHSAGAWLSTALLSLTLWSGCVMEGQVAPAQAYDRVFPDELQAPDEVTAEGTGRGRARTEAARAAYSSSSSSSSYSIPLTRPLSPLLWGAALWLLSGSRSNPLATPLANLLYDDKKEDWLKDRNEGMFADLPGPYLALLALLFGGAGWGLDTLATYWADGDYNISFQVAGVSLITGGFLELGRIFSGEKKPTRAEMSRGLELARDFEEFAQQRLKGGGSVHRNEVVRAFRRYYAKYRQADSLEWPLSDVEIEQLLKGWSRRVMNIEMSAAGFYAGIQINKDADITLQR